MKSLRLANGEAARCSGYGNGRRGGRVRLLRMGLRATTAPAPCLFRTKTWLFGTGTGSRRIPIPSPQTSCRYASAGRCRYLERRAVVPPPEGCGHGMYRLRNPGWFSTKPSIQGPRPAYINLEAPSIQLFSVPVPGLAFATPGQTPSLQAISRGHLQKPTNRRRPRLPPPGETAALVCDYTYYIHGCIIADWSA